MVNGNCRLKKGPLLKKNHNIFRAVVYPLLLVGTVMGNINLFTFVCFTQSFSSDVGLGLLGSNPLKELIFGSKMLIYFLIKQLNYLFSSFNLLPILYLKKA